MFDTLANRRVAAPVAADAAPPKLDVRDLSLWFGSKQALRDVSFDVWTGEILAFIGPSGCGKTTALKCLNRMHDGQRGVRIEGKIRMDGRDVYDPDVELCQHRRRFGWVAQRPNPFPATVYQNVAYGARIHGLVRDRAETDAWVEDCLRRADLWTEVKDGMRRISGLDLSIGQQQRLCIARALATRPEVLLMDEPTGSVDPIATARIENLILGLKGALTIIVITHSMAEAQRVSDRVAFFHTGEVREIGPTATVFAAPRDPMAHDFLRGRYG